VNTTLQHLAIRPFMGLLAAFVLASSATVAVAAETHAAKALPVPTFSSLECQHVDGPKTTVNGELNVEGKGRWVFVWVRYQIDGADFTGWVDELGSEDEPVRLNRQTPKSVVGGPLGGTGTKGRFEVTMYDRKGDPLPGTERVALAEVSCPTP